MGFGSLIGQGIFNVAVLVIDAALLALKECKAPETRAGLLGMTGGALGANAIFFIFSAAMKGRYYCCDVYSPLGSDEIRREKCCYDTSLVTSAIYVAINTVALLGIYYLCK